MRILSSAQALLWPANGLLLVACLSDLDETKDSSALPGDSDAPALTGELLTVRLTGQAACGPCDDLP